MNWRGDKLVIYRHLLHKLRNYQLPAEGCDIWLSVGFVFAGAFAIVAIRSGFPANLGWEGGDDAYITYRYARNIANGHGFVFNPGANPVLGTSTPLFTLILACGAQLGAEIPQMSQLLGMLATAATSAIIAWLGLKSGHGAGGIAAALTWSSSPFTLVAASGMETQFYIAVSVAALLAASARQVTLSLLLASVAILTRLDGFAVLAAIGLVSLVRKYAISRRSWALPIILVGGWTLYALMHFGSVLPTSGLAKMSHVAGISGRFHLWSPTLLYLAQPWVFLVVSSSGEQLLSALVLVVLGISFFTVAASRGRSVVVPLLGGWLIFYLLGFTLLQLPDFGWYYAPPAVAILLLLWISMETFLRSWMPGLSGLCTILLGCFAAMAAWGLAPPVPETPSAHMEAGHWLRAHAAPSSTLVAYEIGKVGFASDLQTIDLLGLTEPRAKKFLDSGDYAWAIREIRPDYVFTNGPDSWPVTDAIFALPEFREGYVLVKSFPFRDKLDYRIYARR